MLAKNTAAMVLAFLSTDCSADFMRDIRRSVGQAGKVASEAKSDRDEARIASDRTLRQISRVEENVSRVHTTSEDISELVRIARKATDEQRIAREKASEEIASLKLQQIERNFAEVLANQKRAEIEAKTQTLERQKGELERRERLWSASTIGLGATTLFGIFGCWLAWRGNSDQRIKVVLEIEKLRLEMARLSAQTSRPTDIT